MDVFRIHFRFVRTQWVREVPTPSRAMLQAIPSMRRYMSEMYQFRNGWIAACAVAALMLASQHALADVAVIVSAKSTVAKMSADEVAQVFLGKSFSMKPVDNGDKAVRGTFYSKVAGKDDAQVKAIWSKLVFTGKARPPAEAATSADVVKAVGNGADLIGYVDAAAVDASVKVVFEVK
jgi:hypothetical protein